MENNAISKTRFNLGEVVLGVCFDTEDDRVFGFSLPYLFNRNKVTNINVVQLTVTEHHRVIGDHDEKDSEPKYDGFILKDQNDNPWYNQYPRASYGQLSDESDRRFIRHTDVPGQYGQWMDNKEVFEVHLLTDVVHNIDRGIKLSDNKKNRFFID